MHAYTAFVGSLFSQIGISTQAMTSDKNLRCSTAALTLISIRGQSAEKVPYSPKRIFDCRMQSSVGRSKLWGGQESQPD
jgi:hypothetical protein